MAASNYYSPIADIQYVANKQSPNMIHSGETRTVIELLIVDTVYTVIYEHM